MRGKWLIQSFRLLFVIMLIIGLSAPTRTPVQAVTNHRAGIASRLAFPTMALKYPTVRFELQLQNLDYMDASVVIELYGMGTTLSYPVTILAGSSKVYTEIDFASAAKGPYAVMVTSSAQLAGVMVAYRLPGALIALYPGTTVESAQTKLFFGPADQHSSLYLMNLGTTPAQSEVHFYGPDGSNITTFMPVVIPTGGGISVNLLSAGVPPGITGSVMVTSTQLMAGVLGTMEQIPSGGPYLPARIYPALTAGTNALYARVLKDIDDYGGQRTSKIFLVNAGSGPGSYVPTLLNGDGSIGPTLPGPTLAINGSNIINLSTLTDVSLAAYALSISGSQPMAFNDVTEYTSLHDNVSAAYYATESASTLWLPRLVNETNQHSKVSIYNTGAEATTATLTVNMPGVPVFTKTIDIPVAGSVRLDLRNLDGSVPDGPGSGRITAPNTTLTAVVDEFYTYVPPCNAPQVTLSHTPQGVVTPDDLVTFTASATGDVPLHYAWKVDNFETGLDSPTFSTTFPEGSHLIEVTATNTCGLAMASDNVSSAVPCIAPSLVLNQTPVGVIYSNHPIHFTAAPSGSSPFHYAWVVDGVSAGSDSPALDVTLLYGDHYVSATVTNECSASDYTSTRAFTVVDAPPLTPDFSLSTLSAAVSHAQANDSVSFVAVLRNTGLSSANPVTFTNKLPDALSFNTGSASASDATAVNFDAGTKTLSWNGNIDPGTPVIILYSTTVLSPPPGDVLVNEAVLTDSKLNPTTLTSNLPFKTGYSLKVNGGALGTNAMAVNLTFTYDANDGVQSYMVSNDSDFSQGEGTTDWLPLTASPQSHPGWMLDPYGDPRQPKTVFIQYKTSDGALFGPFSASILYDTQPPAAPQVSFNPAGGSGVTGRLSASSTPWEVTTSDDNSGVVAIQISTREDFSSMMQEFPVNGGVTRFDWWPSAPGTIYVRAVDRSGNFGPAASQQGFPFLYLPMAMR